MLFRSATRSNLVTPAILRQGSRNPGSSSTSSLISSLMPANPKASHKASPKVSTELLSSRLSRARVTILHRRVLVPTVLRLLEWGRECTLAKPPGTAHRREPMRRRWLILGSKNWATSPTPG